MDDKSRDDMDGIHKNETTCKRESNTADDQ